MYFLRLIRIERSDLPNEHTDLKDIERPGLFALLDYIHFFCMIVRSELERQFFIYTYLGDLVKGGQVYTD
jgi:hypothetical protein